MAFRDEAAWVPIEMDSNVVLRIVQTSALEFAARRAVMGTNTRDVPRSGGATSGIVARGAAYGTDDSTDDTVVLQATKFGTGVPLTDEDLSDLEGVIDVIGTKGADWAGSYAIHLDNACLGSSGAGTVNTTVPFNSVYYKSLHADANASYSASANYSASSTMAGSGGYGVISDLFAQYEATRFYSPERSIVIAHPKLKTLLRKVVDNVGRPVFRETSGLTTISGYVAGASSREVPSLLDIPILFSLGAATSGVPSSAPNGNPLMVVGNKDHLILGVRSGPESKQERLPGTDTIELMYRSRRAFSVGNPNALVVMEYTGS